MSRRVHGVMRCDFGASIALSLWFMESLSSSSSAAKCRSTSASVTSASVAGRQRGSLSLSTITARTPS